MESKKEVRDLRLVHNHDHPTLTMRFLGLRAVDPDGLRVVHSDGESAALPA